MAAATPSLENTIRAALTARALTDHMLRVVSPDMRLHASEAVFANTVVGGLVSGRIQLAAHIAKGRMVHMHRIAMNVMEVRALPHLRQSPLEQYNLHRGRRYQ
mmetsp:Transcript_91410/g.175992  ORF Transcript_91410/g.175992 Transcript_91410/m.175992 type:complete len:103 (-) Transcript_91410:26-334(-)